MTAGELTAHRHSSAPLARSSGSDDSPWVDSVQELVADVQSGCRLSVGGFHFTRTPVASLLALMERGVDDLRYVAWGGGPALEILLAFDAVTEVELCFSAMDVFGLARRFRSAAEQGRVVLRETTALALMTGLRAEAEGLEWGVMQKPEGSSLAEAMLDVDSAGVPMVRIARTPVGVMLLHAQRADDDGQVELAGARGTDLSTLFAAKRLLVTVEERAPTGSLGSPRSFIIPRSHVDRIALSRQGAWPTSCLPYYGADYRALGRFIEAEDRRAVRAALKSPTTTTTMPGSDAIVGALRSRARAGSTQEWTIAELLAAVIARTVGNQSVCSFGSAAPLPAVAYLLAKATHAPRALLMSFNGGYVDVAARPMSLTFGEQLDFESAAAHTGGDETYRWYYQPGRVTHEVVGAAQIDRRGATNNLWLTKADGGRVRLPGQGGMADVANLHRHFMIYLPRHSPRNTVGAVECVSARRAWSDPELRRSYGLVPGAVRIITNLCVFEPEVTTGTLVVTHLHPGIERGHVEEATGFQVEFAPSCDRTPEPTENELMALRTNVDPLRIRDLDFVVARDRPGLLERILHAESTALTAALRGRLRDQEGAS